MSARVPDHGMGAITRICVGILLTYGEGNKIKGRGHVTVGLSVCIFFFCVSACVFDRKSHTKKLGFIVVLARALDHRGFLVLVLVVVLFA